MQLKRDYRNLHGLHCHQTAQSLTQADRKSGRLILPANIGSSLQSLSATVQSFILFFKPYLLFLNHLLILFRAYQQSIVLRSFYEYWQPVIVGPTFKKLTFNCRTIFFTAELQSFSHHFQSNLGAISFFRAYTYLQSFSHLYLQSLLAIVWPSLHHRPSGPRSGTSSEPEEKTAPHGADDNSCLV